MGMSKAIAGHTDQYDTICAANWKRTVELVKPSAKNFNKPCATWREIDAAQLDVSPALFVVVGLNQWQLMGDSCEIQYEPPNNP
jgi:hypothetical protein